MEVKGQGCLWALLLCLMWSVISATIGYQRGLEVEQHLAIEAGAAEWRIDAVTGERSFHYRGTK